MINTYILQKNSPLWEKAAQFAEGCSWRAGGELARLMREGAFSENEAVILAMEGQRFAGFCTLTKKDCCPEELPYSPFVGFVFVDEAFRGRRLSEKMIHTAADLANDLGFGEIFLISGEVGLYEKLGFTKLNQITTVYGETEQLFVMKIGGNNGEIRSL